MKGHSTLLLVALAIAGLPWFRGGYPAHAQWAFGVLCGLALLASTSLPLRRYHPRDAFVDVLWLLWMGWQIWLWLPLPHSVIQALAPATHSAWVLAQQAGIDARPRFSVNPAVGLEQTIASLSLWALYISVRRLGRADLKNIRYLLSFVVLSATLQAVYGVVAHLTGWTLAFIEPGPPAHVNVAHGSFPNRNHFAAYLVLGVVSALALALAPRSHQQVNWSRRLRRWLEFVNSPVLLLRSCMLGMVIAIVLSESRMGNTALAIALSVFATVWILRTRNLRNFTRTALIFASIAVIDVALVSERFGLEQVLERIEETDLDGETRADARSMTIAMIKTYGFWGTGHGSFAMFETQWQPYPDFAPLRHAHNDLLEGVLEFGIPGAAILAALGLIHIMLAMQSLTSRNPLYAACAAAFIAAICAALSQALVEFQFHIPGWRSTFVLLMALVATVRRPASLAGLRSLFARPQDQLQGTPQNAQVQPE